jgi:hypothetical protein
MRGARGSDRKPRDRERETDLDRRVFAIIEA